jgi:thiol:disulfide interchange protein DsbD
LSHSKGGAVRIREPLSAILALLLAVAVTGLTADAAPVKAKHVEAELVPEAPAVEAGKPFTVGLRLKLEPHWHVYWKNPGDAGLPVSVEWDLPEGFAAGPIQWPYPDRIAMDPLLDYGYEGEVLFPVEITPPASSTGGSAVLKAKAKWLVCNQICLPGGADLSLTLPIQAAGKPPAADPASTEAMKELFRLGRARLPLPSSPWTFSAVANDTLVTLVAKAPPGFQGKHPGFLFFPEEQEVIENAALQRFYPVEGGFALDLVRIPPEPSGAEEDGAANDSLLGVAVSERGWDTPDGRKAVVVRAPIAAGGAAPKALAAPVALGEPSPSKDGGTETGGGASGATELAGAPAAGAFGDGLARLAFMLSFAFLGGLILNLMPCVLPVLSLKIFDFVKRSGESRLRIFSHGLVFTAGVLVSFWLLAGLLLVLRQGGQELGWGFQLQSPSFLMVLCALFFFFSLNLFGVFELGYLFTRIGSGQDQEGHMGSFVAGVTATVVATPCTAPFMGSAMGYAFSQPPIYALLVFTFLGLGMASPYLLLAGFPALMRFLPKPGEWMEHLKQFMGFPLLGTAIWLAWVLGKQAGVDALVGLLFVLLLAGLSAWILGKWTALHRATPVRIVAGILALVIFLPAFVLVLMFVDQQRGVAASAAGKAALAGQPSAASRQGIPWEPFSPGRLEELIAQGRPVFIDFTADWCLSCKVNEKVALEKPEVAEKFRHLGVTPLKADWTLKDETIARALAKYGRNSIPLYVLYTGSGDEHVILPEIITTGMVLEALERIKPPATALAR